MEKNLSAIFCGVVAYILLLLYAVTVGHMTVEVYQHGLAKAPKDEKGVTLAKQPLEFPAGTTNTVTTIGGLVSALVVAKLTMTKPGAMPKLALRDATPRMNHLSAFLTVAYLVVWLLVGLAALIVGVLLFPDSNTTIAEIGTTWLGLAVTAGYTYFNVDPQQV